MAWPSFKDKKLPLVLAGPLLRRVTPNSVTVWLALSQSATVTLKVIGFIPGNLSDALPPQATRSTVAVGANLHLVALTARSDKDLIPGIAYTYDLSFSGIFGTKSLAEAVDGFQLAYPPLTLPSFVLPPYTANALRLIHGSCRKPHGGEKKGESHDALPILDDLIAAAVLAGKTIDRPHQLLLTGDQIYADDVADSLLILLTDAANTLFPGWAAPYQIGLRHDAIVGAGFTTDDTRSHLMSLPEWLMMYLFAWSDVVWSELPSADDVVANLDYAAPLAPGAGAGAEAQYMFPDDDAKQGYEDERKRVDDFRLTVPKVRRALANIPTYMICDDHEVTDDWNMTYNFCKAVYSEPDGRQIVQNGLVAYALCQAWGNTPEQFEQGDVDKPAGLQLLEILDKGDQSNYDNKQDAIAKIVGVHDHKTLLQQSPYGVFHDADGYATVNGVLCPKASLDYNYTIEGVAHQIIVTDTRTWRAHPRGGDEPPDLLPSFALYKQIESAPKLAGRISMVVVTTNMPPIASIRAAAKHPVLVGIYGADLYDSWEMPSLQFDRMVVDLIKRLPQDASGAYSGPIVLLSGDVHFSFASRLEYWASAPISAKVVFAQLVASSLKNEAKKTRGLHDDGYTYYPDEWYDWGKGIFEKASMPPFEPEGFLGWNLQSSREVAETDGGEIDVDPAERQTVPLGELTPLDNGLTLYNVIVPTDWHYRLDYLATAAAGQYPGTPPTLPLMDASLSRAAALGAYALAAAAYRDYAKTRGSGRQVVGHNNIAEITFSDDLQHVHHTVRWQESGVMKWGRYTVSLVLDDSTYKKLTASGE